MIADLHKNFEINASNGKIKHPSILQGTPHSQPQNISTLQGKNNKHAIKEHSSRTDIRSFRLCLFAWGFADASLWLADWWTSFLFGSKTSWHSGLPIGQKMRLDRHLHQRNRDLCYLSRSVLSVPNPAVIDSYIPSRSKKNTSYLKMRNLIKRYVLCESQDIKNSLKVSTFQRLSTIKPDLRLLRAAILHRRSDNVPLLIRAGSSFILLPPLRLSRLWKTWSICSRVLPRFSGTKQIVKSKDKRQKTAKKIYASKASVLNERSCDQTLAKKLSTQQDEISLQTRNYEVIKPIGTGR